VGYDGTIADITDAKRNHAPSRLYLPSRRRCTGDAAASIGDAVIIPCDSYGRIEYIKPVAETFTCLVVSDESSRRLSGRAESCQHDHARAYRNPLHVCSGRSETGAPADHSVLITSLGSGMWAFRNRGRPAPAIGQEGRCDCAVPYSMTSRGRRLKPRCPNGQPRCVDMLINRPRVPTTRLHRRCGSARTR